MDDYLTKPVQQAELLRAIDRVTKGLDGNLPPDYERPESSFDREKALERMDGDEELLIEIAAIFVQEHPELMSRIQVAIERRDSDDLSRSAHTLKGCVGNFCAQKAFDAALCLEKMGKSGDWSDVDAAWATLQMEIERLKVALEEMSRTGSVRQSVTVSDINKEEYITPADGMRHNFT